jgi:hypothetical protein
MRKPVAVPVRDEAREQVMRRRPEVVAEVRRTAWKKRGTLKRVALERKEAMWLLKMRLKCGECRTRWMGMMGLAAWVST